MNIRILKIETDEFVDAIIVENKLNLPSVNDGWRFNFGRHAKTKGAHSYSLQTVAHPDSIEGCLIYRMRDDVEPYMAYVEIAPHNHGEYKRYDLVAGCLIAFACRLSFKLGKGPFKGWLAFDVQEASEEAERKLMTMYSKKYGAVRYGTTTIMYIEPENGEQLIEKYLEN